MAPNWAVLLISSGLWVVSLGGLTSHCLRNDLARWWLLRSLPVKTSQLLFTEIGLSCGLGIFLSWSALALIRPLSTVSFIPALIMIPFLVVSIVLATISDILHRSKARILLSPNIAEENVPQPNIWGVLQSMVSVLIPLGILIWTSNHPALSSLGWVSLLVALLVTSFNIQSVLSAFRWIE